MRAVTIRFQTKTWKSWDEAAHENNKSKYVHNEWNASDYKQWSSD